MGKWDGDTLVVDYKKLIAGRDRQYNKLIFDMLKDEINHLKNAMYQVYSKTEDQDTKKYADDVLFLMDRRWRKARREHKKAAGRQTQG